ncbi:MAG: peptidylprolyl isomerase [Actinomycetota bacterium]
MAKYATLVTSLGEIRARLHDDIAPKTVDNFVGLAAGTREWKDPTTGEKRTDPLFNGTLFHRVIEGFMIQGGDPTGTGRGGPGYRFEDEVEGNPPFDKAGYLAMANAGPNTNGCQFFITMGSTPHLNGKHTIFGEVVEGQEVAEAISKVPTQAGDRPKEDVVLERVEISEEP